MPGHFPQCGLCGLFDRHVTSVNLGCQAFDVCSSRHGAPYAETAKI
jgi:hypothetical protein